MATEVKKVNKQAYYFFHVSNDKFKFKVPVRGYSYKSWMDFQTGLGYKVEVEETNEESYTNFLHGTESGASGTSKKRRKSK
jgi:hypothetical protein